MTFARVVLQWVSYLGPLVPLIACAVAGHKRRYNPDGWLLALCLAVSIGGDSLMRGLAESGSPNNWWVTYFYAPLQFAAFAWVIPERRAAQWAGVATILILGFISWRRGPLTEPETIVEVGGRLMMAWLLLGVPRLRRFKPSLFMYAAGAPFAFLMLEIDDKYSTAWVVVWVLYQFTRFAAFVLFVPAVRQRAPRLVVEVSRDRLRTREGNRAQSLGITGTDRDFRPEPASAARR